MQKIKTLAYGDGKTEIAKPIVKKKLSFSGVAFLLASSACVPASAVQRDHMDIGSGYSMPNITNRAQRPAHSNCMPDMEPIAIRLGERRLETVCRGGREFVMTDSHLYIRSRENENREENGAEISMRASITITDMSGFTARGIVDWEPTEDSVAILTRSDRTLTIIPEVYNDSDAPTVIAYSMPFDVNGVTKQRMLYHSGFLFISPTSDDTLVMDMGHGANTGFLPLRSALPDAGFSLRGGRLFFGRTGGDETEIVIKGDSVANISLAHNQKK